MTGVVPVGHASIIHPSFDVSLDVSIDETAGVDPEERVAESDDPTVAEAALAVVDDCQRQGLGRILLQALSEAAHANGIERFRAYVSMDNRQVLESLTAIGATSPPLTSTVTWSGGKDAFRRRTSG